MAIQNDLYSQFQRNKFFSQNQIEEVHHEKISSAQPMSKNTAQQQYQNSMINTASPQELTLMLYNGLIKFINLAIQSVEEKNIEKSNNYIKRSQDIIVEFMTTLVMSYEFSQGLYSLYDYMNSRLIDANIKKDKAILEEVLGFAEELRDTWVQAMKLAKQTQAVNK